jgi:small subunit ribosomal protein S13e
MKGKGKGISGSALPYKRKAPKWVTLTPSAVTDIIVKLAKKGKPHKKKAYLQVRLEFY